MRLFSSAHSQQFFCAPPDIDLQGLQNIGAPIRVWQAIITACFRVPGGPFSCMNQWATGDEFTNNFI